jgi:archaellin
LIVPAAVTAFLLMAYGFHIQDKNRASGAKFFNMVALPLLGEVVVTAKATVTGVLQVVALLIRLL